MRFSIVITCFNQCGFIREAIDSALAIAAHDAEVIVVDDASTDGSADLIREYGNRIVPIFQKSNCGACAARNAGALRALGDYLLFLDGDDLFLPWALKVYDRIICAHKPMFIAGSFIYFQNALPEDLDCESHAQVNFVVYDYLLHRDRTMVSSASLFVIERTAFLNVGGWSPDLFELDDVDLVLKLGVAGKSVIVLTPRVVLHRMHSRCSVWNIPPFLRNIRVLSKKESASAYPGGRRLRKYRRAILGGSMQRWIQRALKAGYYYEAFSLTMFGWLLMLNTVVLRACVILRGRRPVEVINLRLT